MDINIITQRIKPMLYAMKMQANLIEEIYVAQDIDPQLERIREGSVVHEGT